MAHLTTNHVFLPLSLPNTPRALVQIKRARRYRQHQHARMTQEVKAERAEARQLRDRGAAWLEGDPKLVKLNV